MVIQNRNLPSDEVASSDDDGPVLAPLNNHNLPTREAPSSDDGSIKFTELESCTVSHRDLQSRLAAAEESLAALEVSQRELSRALQEASEERDSFRLKLIEAELAAREDEEAKWMERLELSHEVEILKSRFNEIVEERIKREGTMSEILDSIRSAKDRFSKIGCIITDENSQEGFDEGEKSNFDDTLELLIMESRSICQFGTSLAAKLVEQDAMRRKEKKELENSILSLTEENRDISTLLRIALVEKEAVERNLSKLKGAGEQKRGAILQIAERGLQRVGFGFVMGVIGSELQQPDQLSGSAVSDSEECKEEISMASTVEKMMKNLRLEISELRQALEECRLENEHLHSITDEQAHKIAEGEKYTRGLEERQNILTERVEELTKETKEAEEDVARWMEACELEVEAGKAAILGREKEVVLLREDLKRTKSSLEAANKKLHLKEQLARTAMAAQAAAEATLELADKRAAGFRERMEELTRQLEEEAERGRKERVAGGVRRRARYVCWPCQAFRISTSRRREGRARMALPELESLLRFNL